MVAHARDRNPPAWWSYLAAASVLVTNLSVAVDANESPPRQQSFIDVGPRPTAASSDRDTRSPLSLKEPGHGFERRPDDQPSGIFLTSDAADARAFHVYRNEQVAERHKDWPRDPDFYLVQPKMFLSAGRIGVAVPTTNQGGWHVGSRPNYIWEKDPAGKYGVIVYLRPGDSARLEEAVRGQKVQAAVVLDGIGWGQIEPIDAKAGKWGMKHVHTYFSPWMALKLNTHIVIGWRREGNPPAPNDPLRQKLEASLEEWITHRGRAGTPIDHAMGWGNFGRMGEFGRQIMVAALEDMDDIPALFCVQMLTGNLPREDVPPTMAHIALRSKRQALRRTALLDMTRYPREREPRYALPAEQLATLLGDADPQIAAIAFVEAPDSAIAAQRAIVVERLKAYLSQADRRALPIEPKPFEHTINNVNRSGQRIFGQVVSRIGETRLAELSDELADAMIARPDEPAPLDEAVRALEALGAVDPLARLIVGRPDIPEFTLQSALHRLASQPNAANAKALLAVSTAARGGRWNAPRGAHNALLGSLANFCGLTSRVPKPRSDDATLAVRKELVQWAGLPEGASAIYALTRAPRAEEAAVYIRGLDGNTSVAACITALEKIRSVDAASALVKILDREDALEDRFANVRSGRSGRSAMAPPPRHQASLAYLADRALTVISGGKAEDVPAYTGKDVLETRRAYWHRWLQSQPVPRSLPQN